MKKKNIVLLVIDSLRISDISSLGLNNRDLTPNIDYLIKNSLVFKNTIANSPWTLPSHTNFFTGLYTSEHRVIGQNDRLDPKIPCVTQILKDLGYFTICLTQNPFISKVFGLTRGFDIYMEDFEDNFVQNQFLAKNSLSFLQILNKLNNSLPVLSSSLMTLFDKFTMFFSKIETQIKKRSANLESYIKENSINDIEKLEPILNRIKDNKPFYLFINLMDTHYPYMPPMEYLKKFNITNNDFRIVHDFYLNPSEMIIKINSGIKTFKEIEKKTLKKFYSAAVNYVDYVIGKFTNILENLENFKSKDTIFILISDHGEHLGYKDLWTHHYSVYQELLKVPVIIYNKDLFERKIISQEVELKNLFHTIISLALNNENKKNRNLLFQYDEKLSYLYQLDKKSFPDFIYGEYLFPIVFLNLIKRITNKAPKKKYFGNIRFLKNKQYKFLSFEKGLDELYYIQSDPNEKNNIIDNKHEITNSMKEKINSINNRFKEKKTVKFIMIQYEKRIIKKAIDKIIKKSLIRFFSRS